MKRIALLVIIWIVLLSGYDFYRRTHVELALSSVSYAFDVTDPRRCVGFATDVFVAKVVEQQETVYPYKDMPHSKYLVSVSDVLKGSLIPGQSLTIFKDGGLSENRYYMYLAEGDVLPEVGKTYMFLGVRADGNPPPLDGVMTISSGNMLIELEDNNLQDLQNSDTYRLYVEAVENQILYEW